MANGQYNVTAINCRAVAEFYPKWLGFLNGTYDDASLQTENVGEYLDSKYVYSSSLPLPNLTPLEVLIVME